VRNVARNRQLPAGFAETSPLLIGLLGISIPVMLLVWAAVTKSTVVLVLAVLGMFAVGAATLTFVILLAGEGEEHESNEEPDA
jgi:formate-dependent nitrite reductase membrane component NrfD